jgi:1-acyl-sn-glycerol-3-phosphate acyltransferase
VSPSRAASASSSAASAGAAYGCVWRRSWQQPSERLPECLPNTSAALVVANHASYVDSILLTAALPPRFGNAAKRELASAALFGTLLRRLGAVFVERVDAAGGVEDTVVLEAHARAGEPLVIFPEGTFRRAPGLLPFKLGAFVVAAHTGAPIIPVALVGTRSLLRAGEWLPRRCEIVITIGTPIVSIEHDWDAALGLRDAARSAILVMSARRSMQPGVRLRARR